MSMFSSDGVVGGSFNNDVLDAQPTDESQRNKLVDEIKNRAKGCITQGNLPEAIKLYTKAAELTAESPVSNAIIFANRSMLYSKMNRFALALDDANIAVERDSTYAKGYYRKATALSGLSDFAGAKSAVLAGLVLKPDDKELAGMLLKISSQETAAAETSTSAAKVPIASKTVTTTSSSNCSKTTVATNKKNVAAPAIDEENVGNDAKVMSDMKGYKKTSDGRTTTFFNRELDETAKALIGDIAPKKLDISPEDVTAAAASATSGSAWNTAGTYEETILSDWAIERLKDSLNSVSFNVDVLEFPVALQQMGAALCIESLHVQVTEAAGVQGHAQVSCARGKRKYLADMSADLKWTLSLSRSNSTDKWVVQGTIAVIDISADKEMEWSDVVVTKTPSAADGITAKEVSEIVKHFVRADSAKNPQCLYTATLDALGVFCTDLKTK